VAPPEPELSPYIRDLEHYAINSENVELDIDQRVQLVIFLLNGEYFALSGRNVKEIVNEMKIDFLPGAPEAILGIINLRGDVESVIDLKHILKLPESESSLGGERKILIAVSGEYQCGILVDELLELTDLPEEAIRPVEGALKRSFQDLVSAEFTYNSRVVFLLDMEKVMPV